MRAILHTLKLTVAALKDRWHALIPSILLLCIGIAALSVIAAFLSGGLATLVTLASVPLYIVVAVRIHKQILLEDQDDKRAVGVNTFFQYLAASFIVAFIGLMPAMLAYMFSVAVTASSGYFTAAVIGIGVAAALNMASRASLILPERALDRTASLSQAWQWSANNGWRLAGALFMPPLVFSWTLQLVLWPMPVPAQSVIESVLGIPIMVFEVALLSVAYRELRNRNVAV